MIEAVETTVFVEKDGDESIDRRFDCLDVTQNIWYKILLSGRRAEDSRRRRSVSMFFSFYERVIFIFMFKSMRRKNDLDIEAGRRRRRTSFRVFGRMRGFLFLLMWLILYFYLLLVLIFPIPVIFVKFL